MSKKPLFILDALAWAGLAVFAAAFSFLCGRRGFFAFDQSIVFDGAHRILCGQVPYRDVLFPFGPVVFWLQAAFFRVLGTNYWAYLAGAALINALAALGSAGIVRLLFPKQKATSFFAGALTAIWFYPPFGTPWPDQTAFFFVLTATGALVIAWHVSRGKPRLSAPPVFLAGVLTAAAFLSKQNAGGFFVLFAPLLLGALALPDLRKTAAALAAYIGGVLGGAIAFFMWLAARSDPRVFVRTVFEIPALLGAKRLVENGATFWERVSSHGQGGDGHFAANNLLLLTALAVAMVGLVRSRRGLRLSVATARRDLLAGALIAVAVCYQYLLIFTSNNQPENHMPFVGLIAALALGMTWDRPDGVVSARRAPAWILTAVILIGSAIVAVNGLGVSINRSVHAGLEGASFAHSADVQGLEPVRWGQPTKIWDTEVSREEFKKTFRRLRRDGKAFFVFPDFTVFYGLTGQPSPQPLLWFHCGLTYPRRYDVALDQRIVDSLRSNRIERVVLEKASFYGSRNRIDDFPLLAAYITDHFTPADQIGIFVFFEKDPKTKPPLTD